MLNWRAYQHLSEARFKRITAWQPNLRMYVLNIGPKKNLRNGNTDTDIKGN